MAAQRGSRNRDCLTAMAAVAAAAVKGAPAGTLRANLDGESMRRLSDITHNQTPSDPLRVRSSTDFYSSLKPENTMRFGWLHLRDLVVSVPSLAKLCLLSLRNVRRYSALFRFV